VSDVHGRKFPRIVRIGSRARDPWFESFLAREATDALPFERIPPGEAAQRSLRPPHTNLGVGRRRFEVIAQRLRPAVAAGAAIADVGAYPGTTMRLVRALPGGERPRLAAVGFSFDDGFRAAVDDLDAELIEAEFDIRALPEGVSHLLDVEGAGGWDVVVCSEVVEHTLQPLALLLGCRRLLRPGGELLLTTNSASFVGDVLKLASGRHNVEALDRSHILVDHEWRPHMRLYLLSELDRLLELCGFSTLEAFYFDGGNVYAGPKGAAIAAVRTVASCVPRLRSHIFIRAVAGSEPQAAALQRAAASFRQFGLPVPRSVATSARG